jgi:arylsulfatase A-like enzyme
MNRRAFLKSVAVSGVGAAVAPQLAPPLAAAPQRPPNVLFILADQWRFSAFSHETDPLVQTPNLDRFAAAGARWTRAYAANPVCTPNRSCLLTGRYAHQHGMIVNNLMLPPKERCVAESFAEAGYATHYIGKWHMDGEERPGFVPPGWRRRGFKTFEGFNRGHWYPTGAQYFTDDGTLLKPPQFESVYQTDLAIGFMKKQRAAGHPFVCYLSWGPPHTPYRPPKEFDRFSKLEKLQWRPNVPEKLRDTPKLKQEMAGYFGLCETLDHEMGRLLKALDELGLADNTLVVFTADHGDMHGSHGLYRKGKPQEESLHIPLFMRLPGRIKPKQTPATLVNSIDLMPTVTAICGLKAPRTCTGRDLSAAVLGGPASGIESLYAQGAMTRTRNERTAGKARLQRKNVSAEADEESAPGGEWRALVTPTHKLVVNVSGQTLLYDLAKDPYELKNLADQREHAALKEELTKQLKRWAKDTDDPYPKSATPAKSSYTDEEAARARG